MAALLALLSAVWFALSAALQQRGQFALAHGGTPVEGLAGLVRLLAVSVILGILLSDEQLTRPAWHVVVAVAALVAALAGAVLTTLAHRETPIPGVDTKSPEAPRADPAPA